MYHIKIPYDHISITRINMNLFNYSFSVLLLWYISIVKGSLFSKQSTKFKYTANFAQKSMQKIKGFYISCPF